jgi:hypothetical protein
VLKDEESRSNFDIQMYAERIIGRLQQAAVPDMVCACVVVDALNMVCACVVVGVSSMTCTCGC